MTLLNYLMNQVRTFAGNCPWCGKRTEVLRCSKCGYLSGRCCAAGMCPLGCGGSMRGA